MEQQSELPNILLVDDKPENLIVLEKLLAKFDVNLHKATSGNDALAMTLDTEFMLILMDVQMPVMDGYEVLDMLSWDDKTKNIPVIFITANYADEKHQLKGYEYGAVDYLFKPINKQILLGKVQVFLDLHREKSKFQQLQKRYELLLNAAGEGVFGLDKLGNINFVNPAAANLLAQNPEQLIDSAFAELLPNSANEDFNWEKSEIFQTCRKGDVYKNDDAIFVTGHSSQIPVEYTANPIPTDDNQFNGVVVVFSDITLRKTVEEQLTHMALYDHLTDLPNRLLFDKQINQMIARAERHKRMLAVMFLDLDHFKNINDTLGHDIGDLLLKKVAERLKTCVRETDTVARLGGDEFAIILDEIDRPEDCSVVAEKIIETLKPPFKLNSHEVFVGTSIGIAVYPISGDDPITLTKNADIAMYRTKHHGRNNYSFFTSGMSEQNMHRLNLAHSLRHSLDRSELFLCYQPKLNIRTNQIIGMEVLLRWEHPNLGQIFPNEFIPIAEEIGLMNSIGEWVIRTACIKCKDWLEQGIDPKRIAVNISSSQLIQGDLCRTIKEILEETDLDPKYLELELTETIIMVNAEKSKRTLEKIHDLGVHISIDDFGTGYSSLSYVKSLPVDTLKIDQSFVRDVSDDPNDAAIVKAIIALAHSMDLNVIAEGVEKEEQLQFLKENDCDEVQGYLFSKPLTSDDMHKFLLIQ